MPLPRYKTVRDAIANRKTDLPLLCIRPHVTQKRVETFARRFPGTVAYAIKTQNDPEVMKAVGRGLAKAGKPIAFDVASIREIEHARALFPRSELFFMHPMKKRSAIEQAYRRYKVRHFVVDHASELGKFAAAGVGRDATILVRIATPAGHSSGPAYDLSDKFGASPSEALALLRAIDKAGHATGIAFHVGSQEKDAAPWRASIALALELRRRSKVAFRILDIGGGFPGVYAGGDAKSAGAVFSGVLAGLKGLKTQGFDLVSEPGRAIAYDCMSVVTEVVGKKAGGRMGRGAKRSLYIDEGIWSTLSESLTASKPGAPWQWPVTWHMDGRARAHVAYRVGGVTCDSVDVLKGRYSLPENLEIGDFLEFGNIGAYGTALSSHFNGFGEHERVIVDEPFRSGAR